MKEKKIMLSEKDIPRRWYNLAADFKNPPKPPWALTEKPVNPDMLAPVFPMNLIEQEMSTERWIKIPEEILEILYRWRPTRFAGRSISRNISRPPPGFITKMRVSALRKP